MPNYDYVCSQCGHREEILQKITDDSLTTCPQCHQSTFKRKIGMGLGLQFQGSGFYSTDYPSNNGQSNENLKEKGKDSPSSQKGCGCGKTSCSS